MPTNMRASVVDRSHRDSSFPPSPLQVAGFGRRYRRNRPWAVRGANFSLPEGTITALVGPNGAGKSTLIRACLGFERADEGRISVFGADPHRHRTQAVEAIGYVAQHLGLYRSLTIADHFTMAQAARPAFDRIQARLHLGELGLPQERQVADLSGGEQAQVALALALGTRAPLLLLDEPLASLDPLARRDFLRHLVADVRSRGATALLSSHIVSDVEEACDRLLVVANGQLVLDTAVSEAKQRFRTVLLREYGDTMLIGSFAAAGGEILGLIADGAAGRPASLEEIVLGHLAVGRIRPESVE
jgi:ABC-2 type transport system ATP-binding protein